MLAKVENVNIMDCPRPWWIGLNDKGEEGQYKWPVGGQANFTWWDEEHDEPRDPSGDHDCVNMMSVS